MAKLRARHTITSLISATGKSKRTILDALEKGWFGPVELKKINKVNYYIMSEDSVEFYKKKKYEKKVVVERDDTDNYFTYKYTMEEAKVNANIRAEKYMEDKERVRLEMLGKGNLTEEDVKAKAYNTFLIEESNKKIKVTQGKLTADEQRELLALPLNFPTLVLDKMLPNQSVYMMEKIQEYINTIGKDKWKEPWIRNTIINLIQEEIYQHYLHDLRRFKQGIIHDKIDDALTKSETRWIKLTDSLGLSLRKTGGGGGDDEEPHERHEVSNAADNL